MIKKLSGCIREYKKASILTPVFVMLEVIMEVLMPLITAKLIDNGINAGDMSWVLKMSALLLIAAAGLLTFGAFSGRYASAASAGFARNLRHDMFYNVQNFSFSNIDKFSTSSIVTRMTTDVSNIQTAYQMLLRMAVRAPVMMTFSLVASFSISRSLSMVFVAVMPVLLIGLYIIMQKAHPVFERVFKTYDRLSNVVQENLRGIRVVKSFVRGDFENQKFENISDSISKDFAKAEKTLAFNMPLMQFCMYFCTLLLSWLGAKAIVASGNNPALGLSTGTLMSLITYTMQILGSLMALSMVFVMMTMSRASMERVCEILSEESDIRNSKNPVFEVKNGDVSFDDVSFSYRKNTDKPCLDHINLRISSGQTIGILGGTGSSKSSLVQLIPRLYDVTEGSVKVGGVDVRDYDIESLRNSVAMVLQKNELFSGTLKENLRWGDESATDDEIIHACKLAQADGFIQTFPDGYDTHIEQGGTNVSGGQKQRICIARALLKKPKILILDDSTSAVDMETDALIRRAFREEIPDITKIIIAQRVASVEDADAIIIMDDGKISAFGSHEELLETSDIYREVYESQVKGGGEDE